jgi:hypothetical protein
VLYEAVQVLEQNRLIIWRYRGRDHVYELASLTRRGRSAFQSSDIRAYLPHC